MTSHNKGERGSGWNKMTMLTLIVQQCYFKFLELKTTAPRDVLITANTTSSLTISWEKPSTTDTNITYYSICYRESSTQDCRTKIVEPHVQSAILENLNSSTEYRIRVRAHTCNGPGEYSNEISQKTSKIGK